MKALVFEEFGEPDVLHLANVPDPELTEGTVLVRMQAIGLNFADIYRRRGNYHLAGTSPFILGYEGAGIVEAVSPDNTRLKPGDRVGFADVPFANAELVKVPVDRAIPIPDDIPFETAASLFLQGMTAHYLIQDSFQVHAHHEVLIHAAAGGVGQLLIQLCKLQGARIIGLTSSNEKREVALKAGADEVFLYDSEWSKGVVAASMSGFGMDVAYDSVGTTLMDSFAVVKTKGTVVFYGMAGGDPPHVDPRMLMDTSKTLTGGDLWNHVTTLEDRKRRMNDLFQWVRQGKLKLDLPATFALKDGAEAHRRMESRESTGKILMIP